MKRILALFLSAALLLALLCACGGSADSETTVIPSDSAGESATVPPGDTTQEPSLALPNTEPSEEPSAAPGFGGVVVPGFGESAEPTAEPSQEPSQAPATQPPATQPPATQAPATQPPVTQPPATQPPAPSPTVPGGGIIIPGLGGGTGTPTDAPGEDPNGFTKPTGPSASDVNLTSFYQAILNNYAFPEMGEYDGEWVANYYPGLLSIPVVQRLVIAPRMTGNAAELVLVQVADGSDTAAVKSILQARIDRGKNDFNYPQVTEAWQNNSRVVSNGNHIMLVVHSEYDAIIADFNALF